jgi:hypothetical protein
MDFQPGQASQFPTVGRWSITVVPRGWIFAAGFGIRQMSMEPNAVVASVGLVEDAVESEHGLIAYLGKQKELIGGYLKEPAFAGPQPIAFPGADEAQLFFIRHTVEPAGQMLHAQTYVRSGLWLGIITLTSQQAQVSVIRPDYDAFVKGLRILQPPR